MKNLIMLFYFAYGLVIGSFLNVCIYRIPIKESVVKGRSHCTSCGYTITPYDLVPVFSYLFLGGKCRNCKQKISPRYAIVEALTGILFALAFLRFDLSLKSVIICLMGAVLVVISFIDLDTKTIPDGANLFLLALGIISIFIPNNDVTFLSQLAGAFIISIPMIAITYFTSGFGGGDIKLFAVGGFIIGFANVVIAFFVSVVSGGIYAVYLLLIKKADKKDELPFGAFIALGIFIGGLYGDFIVAWYLGLLGM